MNAVQTTLRRLRNWFVVWFVVQAVIGTAAAAYVIEGLGRLNLFREALGHVSPGFTLASGILGSVVMLLLALLVFAALLELRPWARICLLVVGWLTVVSAVSGLVIPPGIASFVQGEAGVAGADWQRLVAANVLTKAVDLAFWAWAIYTLQFNALVRGAFVGGSGEETRPGGTATPA